ncbi:MAG: sigma 54-interacting transcriptional regulator [Desulfosarcina sp.]
MMSESINQIPSDLLSALLDNPYESLILIDADGIIRFMSSSNEGIYPFSAAQAVGRHIAEVSPRTRMPRVLKSGKAEIGRSMILDDKQRIIARIPLFRDGRVIGAAGKLMFMSPEQLKQLYDRIDILERHLDYYKEELGQVLGIRYTFDNIIGQSEAMRQAKALAGQAAQTDSSVIITGESGTGKELFAHAIHQASRRRKHNFVRVNCAAIPGDLIEAELFGYAPGAFTGASRQGKVGKFELAHNGTILLDEIGDMQPTMQVKLMRVLQEKEVDRIGGNQPRRIDFRIISATNQDLEQMMGSGRFRLDLYFRVNVININLPSLRRIRADIPLIFDHLLNQLSRNQGRRIEAVAPDVREALAAYAWPGNVRELRNVVERALIVCRHDRIEMQDLPLTLREARVSVPGPDLPPGSLKTLMQETERKAIVSALAHTGHNRADTARLLGIHRTGLYQKMKKYRIGS